MAREADTGQSVNSKRLGNETEGQEEAKFRRLPQVLFLKVLTAKS